MNTYERFEKAVTDLAYDFARSVDKDLQECEFDRENGAARAQNIHNCLSDIVPGIHFQYAQAILAKAMENAKKKVDHLYEVYGDKKD